MLKGIHGFLVVLTSLFNLTSIAQPVDDFMRTSYPEVTIHINKSSLELSNQTCRLRCISAHKQHIIEFPDYIRINCKPDPSSSIQTTFNDSFIHLIRFGANYETIDTMSIETKNFRNLSEITLDSLEFKPGRFMIELTDLLDQNGNSAKNKSPFNEQYTPYRLKSGAKPIPLGSITNTWEMMDFTYRGYVFDEINQPVPAKEPNSVANISPWGLGKFQDYFELDSLWISSDKKHYKMALRYISPETLDLNDIIHYRPIEAKVQKLLDEQGKLQVQENYGIYIRKFHGKELMFKYHFEVFEREKTNDRSRLLYVRLINPSKHDPRKIIYPGESSEGSNVDTVAVYIPGKVFHLSGDIRSLIMENFMTETSTLRMNALSFDHALKYPQNHYKPNSPNPFIREFFIADYYYVTHEKEQVLTDKINYSGHYDAQIEKITYDGDLIKCKITKFPMGDHPSQQQFEVEIRCDSKVLLKKKEILAPVKIEFKDGSVLNLTYGYKCHWKE